jgi:hypothetical protein
MYKRNNFYGKSIIFLFHIMFEYMEINYLFAINTVWILNFNHLKHELQGVIGVKN